MVNMDQFTESTMAQNEANGIVLGKWHDINKTAHLQKTGPERGKSIVRVDPAKIRKQCSSKETELTFYKNLADLGDAQVDEENCAVVLEDITYRLDWPAVIDIKIGFETHDRHENAHVPHHYEKDEQSSSSRFGFRLVGYVFYRNECDGTSNGHGGSDERRECESASAASDVMIHMTPQDLLMKVRKRADLIFHLKRYFTDVNLVLRKNVLVTLLPQLSEFLEWKKSACYMHYYASSILIAFNAQNRDCPDCRFKLIDLAHFTVDKTGGPGQDVNFIGGLENLINVLKEIHNT